MSTVTPLPLAQFVRVAETARASVSFVLDGVEVKALAGDTLLTAILTHQRHVRRSEFSTEPRAGFCLIGACQDCWVRSENGTRLRACSTPLREGMRVLTRIVSDTESYDGGAR
ncbi:(2Fe-2S)-binding protein [Paraburkholderia sp. CNPSo 3281]|uniref:(2Fe-2S)-binding protein n=1 Tax=Paraburkholderia sp. CNPSo 3281 TaxID=2940933 RepID=UPI0020B6D1C0|nr:(2Fe-2S)-binding protein [Paraburkholderia sp. CNPSo 3281]MCP3719777.1 (2Fe-2S)-binding protein [Paraburkholderia sp. CNPSo 3281]